MDRAPIQCRTADYPLHSPLSPSLLLPCFAVCYQIPFPLYNTQASNINIKHFVFLFIPVRFHKAYVNQFLALPNAMYSHSAYLYWKSIREEGNIKKYTGEGPSTLRRWQLICYLVTSELPWAVAHTPRSLHYKVSLSGRRIGQVWRHGRRIVRRIRWSPHFSLAIISVTVTTLDIGVLGYIGIV